MRIGCRYGCPLDHHEPPCPRAETDSASFEAGYRAAEATAREFFDLGYRAGREAPRPTVIPGTALPGDASEAHGSPADGDRPEIQEAP